MTNNTTLNYYNENANKFVTDTKDVAFDDYRQHLLKHLKSGDRILDFGCGSGRDSKAFLDAGYNVKSIDGSAELCAIAKELTGLEVEHSYFEDLSDESIFDGIWACSSILHVPYLELPSIFCKIKTALVPGGLCVTSFKYGTFEGMRNGRYFTDLNEELAEALIDQVNGLTIESFVYTSDARPGREDEQWLTMILRKDKS